MRLNGEGDCINWKDFLDWIMFDNLYLIGAGPFEVRGGGGVGRCMGDLVCVKNFFPKPLSGDKIFC